MTQEEDIVMPPQTPHPPPEGAPFQIAPFSAERTESETLSPPSEPIQNSASITSPQAPVQVAPQMPIQATYSNPQPQTAPPLLHCQDLVKNYGVVPALGPVTMSLFPGRIVGLLGPNGSGKTTLIKTVAGLLTPQHGEVRICGYKPGVKSKALVSYLPEQTYLSSWMKVSDALDYFEDFYSDFSRERAIDMLNRLQVPLFAYIGKLSKGTKEKVQLILVMARQSKLYLLDEPIAGVDPAARDYILDTIISSYDRSATIVISTHLISDIEKVLDDYIFMNRGQIVSAGPVSGVYEAGWPSLDTYFREAFRC